MYTHIAKDWSVVQLPNQAKNAIDATIQANDRVKKQIKNKRIDMIRETVDNKLYEIKWVPISYGKLPRKQ